MHTKIIHIHKVNKQENNFPNKLKKLALSIFHKFNITPKNQNSTLNIDKVIALNLRNIDLSIRILPAIELNSYLLNISFIPEAIDKNELLNILNKYSKYFISLDEILNNYYADPNSNNTKMLYYASFSGADLPDERIVTIFKQILNKGDEDQILFLCASVIVENTLYYDVLKEPLQEALAKTSSPILNDTYKDVLAFIEDYSEL
jgi:hypothetical protein